jgi:hypothetical protein
VKELFRQGLDKSERKMFDEMFSYLRLYNSAGNNACRPILIHPIGLNIFLPGAPSGFIVLTTIHLSQRRYNYPCFILIGSSDFLSFPLTTYLCNVVQKYNTMGDEKKKETKIEKKDEFGNVIEKQEIEEKEED